MRTLILFLALVLGVSHAPNLAGVQAVAAQAAAGTGNEDAYQLVPEDRRVGDDHQSLARQTASGWLALTNAAESTPISARAASPAAQAGEERTSPQAPGKGPVNGGWVNDCPCGPDCRCVDPAICKNGDCKKNIIVLFTAKWCPQCPRQKLVMEQLQKEGYIVYVLDYDTHKEQAEELRIASLPTTLIFNEGKEVARYIGFTRAEQVKSGVKKRDEQKPTPKPTPDPYDFSP
jgi:thiol-disulfide isomerase/thioredoxin